MPADALTRAALLTPAGRGAIASIAVDGPLALEAVSRYFSPAGIATTPARSASESNPSSTSSTWLQSPASPNGLSTARENHRSTALSVGRIVFGRWNGPTGEEVVACRRGNDAVEIHCHGGRAAAAAILDDLSAAGCRIEGWAERAARLHDPLSAAALVALSQARTERTARILLDQYRGALAQELGDVAALLTRDPPSAVDRLEDLQRRSRLGLRLTQPWRVVLAGRPNVGKSSLLNALVGYRRSVVYDRPGTTRDVVRATTAIDGWPVEFSDTAGLRSGGDELEAAGIALARRQLGQADLALLAFDRSAPWTAADAALLVEYPDALVVQTKCDLPARPDGRPAGLPTSALRGLGVERLLRAIAARLVPSAPPPGAAVPFTPYQASVVAAALAAAQGGDVAAALASIADCLQSRPAISRSGVTAL